MRDNSGHGRFFTSSDSTARDAAVAAAVGFAGIAVCEIALAVGAPFGSRGLGQRPRSPLDRAAGLERSRRGCKGGRCSHRARARRDVVSGQANATVSLGTWFLGGLSAPSPQLASWTFTAWRGSRQVGLRLSGRSGRVAS